MKRILVIVCILIFGVTGYAQPYIDEIHSFRKEDSIRNFPGKANLFVGSSSLRMWKSIQADFPGYKVINRGFGGSTLPDVIRYVDDIIYPYNPKEILIYCGENDLAASDTVSAQTVDQRFQQLFWLIRHRWKKTPVVFISIKPSPSRAHLMPKIVEANRLVKAFLETQKHTKYVDVYTPMLDAEGKPRGELFLGDNLHMNEKGYAIWIKAIRPVLKK